MAFKAPLCHSLTVRKVGTPSTQLRTAASGFSSVAWLKCGCPRPDRGNGRSRPACWALAHRAMLQPRYDRDGDERRESIPKRTRPGPIFSLDRRHRPVRVSLPNQQGAHPLGRGEPLNSKGDT